MGKPASNQHYVPQLYLRQFIPNNSVKLLAYDKLYKHVKSIGVGTACAEDGFYDLPLGVGNKVLSIVDDLNDSRESIATELRIYFEKNLKKLTFEELSFDVNLRVKLALVVIHQFIRTKAFRSRLSCKIPPIMVTSRDYFHHWVTYTITKLIPQYKRPLLELGGLYSFADNKWTTEQLRCLTQCSFLLDPIRQQTMESAYLLGDWKILVSESELFVTSDNPVVIAEDNPPVSGWGSPGNTVVWPISSKLCMLVQFKIAEETPTKSIQVISSPTALTKYLNQLQFRSASRYVFADTCDQLLKLTKEPFSITAPSPLESLFRE